MENTQEPVQGDNASRAVRIMNVAGLVLLAVGVIAILSIILVAPGHHDASTSPEEAALVYVSFGAVGAIMGGMVLVLISRIALAARIAGMSASGNIVYKPEVVVWQDDSCVADPGDFSARVGEHATMLFHHIPEGMGAGSRICVEHSRFQQFPRGYAFQVETISQVPQGWRVDVVCPAADAIIDI